MKLDFSDGVEIGDYDLIYPYTSRFGEGSCQHSPVSMYSLNEKYQDCFCIKDDFMFTLRRGLCDDDYRVYFAPFGDGDIKAAFEMIFSDASEYGKKVKFFTLTEKYASLLDELFPEKFSIEENRDFAEYIYTSESMATFAGGPLKKRRAELRTFQNIYGDRAKVELITPDDYQEIEEFEKEWLIKSSEDHDMEALNKEARMIYKQLKHFEELHLIGITLRIDGVLKGFCYGPRLNPDYYDVMIEKADRQVPHVYKVIRSESTKLCAFPGAYVNMEEDVGVEGLRAIKMAYKPAYLLNKFVAVEV